MNPKRVRWVAQAAMRVGICGEKIAELIMDAGPGHAHEERHCHAAEEPENSYQKDGKCLMPRHMVETSLDRSKPEEFTAIRSEQ
jgi:hypothetical protein